MSAFYPAHGGGIEVVAGKLASMFALGMDVTWMAGGPPSEATASESSPHLRTERARSMDLIEGRLGLPLPIWSPFSLFRLMRFIRDSDIVHAHDYLYMGTIAAYIFSRYYRKPFVLTQHIGAIPYRAFWARSTLSALNHTIGRWIVSKADQTVFVGKQVMDYYSAFSRFKSPPTLISNGVDHTRYHPVPRSLRADSPVEILFVGRFTEKKGISLLKSCIDIPNTKWSFIGWGPESPSRWGAAASEINVHEQLRADELIPHYQSADLLVLPSVGEGFPLVVQESLACGTPVLVSSEVFDAFPVNDASCIHSVDLGSEDPAMTLRCRLVDIIQDRDQLLESRENAATISCQWSWESCANAYKSVFSRLILTNPD